MFAPEVDRQQVVTAVTGRIRGDHLIDECAITGPGGCPSVRDNSVSHRDRHPGCAAEHHCRSYQVGAPSPPGKTAFDGNRDAIYARCEAPRDTNVRQIERELAE